MNARTLSEPDWSVYRSSSFPHSASRVFLPHAFEQYCIMRWGLIGDDIADAFEAGAARPGDRECLMMGIELLGGLFVHGVYQTWARPIGGGVPEEITADRWELDDFTARFATGMINVRRPFDLEAEPTHAIFVDRSAMDEWLEACCTDLPGYSELVRARSIEAETSAALLDHGLRVVAEPVAVRDGFLRMPEIVTLTGLAKSTIYARIKRGEFPVGVDLGGRVTGWHAHKVDKWMAGRGRR